MYQGFNTQIDDLIHFNTLFNTPLNPWESS